MGLKGSDIDAAADIRTTQLLDGRNRFGNRTNALPFGQRIFAPLANVRYHAGTKAFATLRLASNVVDGTTVTIGPIEIDGVQVTIVFEIDIINTDAGVNTDAVTGAMTNAQDPAHVFLGAAPASPRVAGDLLRIENEIMKVLRVVSPTDYVVARARCGTSIATHAANLDVFFSDAAPAANTPVGLVAVLTPAVFGPALAAEINNALSGNERAASKIGTLWKKLKATSLQAGAEVLLEALNPGTLTTALAETLAGANNAWDTAAMRGGSEPGAKASIAIARVPNAQEVALDFMRVPIPFTPAFVGVEVRVTATGVAKAWDGGVLFANGVLSLSNAGATDWATTDTVYIMASE